MPRVGGVDILAGLVVGAVELRPTYPAVSGGILRLIVCRIPAFASSVKLLGWRARYGIERMCEDHWRWQEKNLNGFV